MTTAAPAASIGAAAEQPGYPDATRTFTRLYGLFGLLFVGGLGIDLWAHNNIRPLLETFFTPWHGLLYGGFFLFGGLLVVTAARNHAEGYPLVRSLPRGYELALLGTIIFSVGGLFDLAWHTVFGIEADFDALISPSHLVLVTGGTLMASAALRAAASTPERAGWPAAISGFATAVVLLPFLDFFLGPFATRTATGAGGRDALEPAQILATLTYTAVVGGVCTYLIRSVDRLPRGAIALIVGGSAAVTVLIRGRDLGAERNTFLVVAIAVAVFAELLVASIGPRRGRPDAIRAFGAALPVVILAPYFVAVVLTLPVTWSIHALAGTIALASAAGGLLAVLATPEAAKP